MKRLFTSYILNMHFNPGLIFNLFALQKNVLIRPIIVDQHLAMFTTKDRIRDIGKDIIIKQLHQHRSSVPLLFLVSLHHSKISAKASQFQTNFANRMLSFSVVSDPIPGPSSQTNPSA